MVGAYETLKTGETGGDPVEAFYRALIPRLVSEVEHANSVARLVGYRAWIGQAEFWQFLGIELRGSLLIPDGMVALVLGENSARLIDRQRVHEFSIEWTWKDTSSQSFLGEFESVFPSSEGDVHSFCLTANMCLDVAGSPAEDAVELAEYDDSWPRLFDDMAQWLRINIPAATTRIVHYGSTSVPGMLAKPVIDILVETPSFEVARRTFIPALNNRDWEYWWYSDHMIFIKRDAATGKRTHHIHIAPPGHRLWEGVRFRDYLIAHPETAAEYAALKQELAARYRTEREKYTEAKTAFIRAVT